MTNDDFEISFFKRKQGKISKNKTKSCSTSTNTSEKTVGSYPCKSLTSLSEVPEQLKTNHKNLFKSKWNWSTPQLDKKAALEDKIYERKKNSEWTNLKSMYEFLKKSREALLSQNTEHSDRDNQEELSKPIPSLRDNTAFDVSSCDKVMKF